MTGVVLCGGQSTRMGSDKGLMPHQAATWAEVAAAKLNALHLPVVLSVNAKQYETYRQLFQNLMLITDDATLNVGGPLKGILSVHAQQPQEDLLVLACDMRDMQARVLQHLVAVYRNSPAEALVFRSADQVEPLCGIYSAAGLRNIRDLYAHGLLKKYSMHYILQLLQTCYIPMPEEAQSGFKNFNSAADLDTL